MRPEIKILLFIDFKIFIRVNYFKPIRPIQPIKPIPHPFSSRFRMLPATLGLILHISIPLLTASNPNTGP